MSWKSNLISMSFGVGTMTLIIDLVSVAHTATKVFALIFMIIGFSTWVSYGDGS